MNEPCLVPPFAGIGWLSTAEFAARATELVGHTIHRDRITYGARRGLLLARRVGGRWEIAESELESFVIYNREAS